MIKNKDLKRRILEISFKHKLSHLGSCLTAVDIIKEIYDIKEPKEKFVNDSGHSGLALYTVIEYATNRNANDIFDHHGVHPDRCSECAIDCSTGSLGQGVSIAVGMALADRSKKVFCLMSDGGSNEGSFWEALRIAQENNLDNLKIYLNANNWAAYKEMDDNLLEERIKAFGFPVEIRRTNMNDYPGWLQGLQAHYVVMDEIKYEEIKRTLE